MHINSFKKVTTDQRLNDCIQRLSLGIKFMFDDHLVTVWSAPNYCYRCGNIAAILTFHTATNHETKLFNAVPDSQRIIPSKTTTPYFL